MEISPSQKKLMGGRRSLPITAALIPRGGNAQLFEGSDSFGGEVTPLPPTRPHSLPLTSQRRGQSNESSRGCLIRQAPVMLSTEFEAERLHEISHRQMNDRLIHQSILPVQVHSHKKVLCSILSFQLLLTYIATLPFKIMNHALRSIFMASTGLTQLLIFWK
jgi:hypothetical protein